MTHRIPLAGLFIYVWLLPQTTFGQACYLQQDCGPGMLCSESGTCRPIRELLSTGSNTVYWVDQGLGNDGNPGTEAQPFKSISRAMRSSTLDAGDAVIIREGTYYEPVNPETSGKPGSRITIAGYPGEDVVVSGATKINGTWEVNGSTWKIAWPFDKLWHKVVSNDPYGPARRRDVVIANGQMLQAVYDRNDVQEGTFFLEGSPHDPTTLYVRLPGDANPNDTRMETSLVNHLFLPSNNDPNCMHGDVLGYFHLIGITFRHAANDAQAGAVCTGSEGSIIENVTVEWTNGSGFLISGKDQVVRGVRAFHNGMSGIRGQDCNRCLLEHAVSKYNNWKGYKPFWESGGGKWLYTTNSTFRHLDFSDNEGPGLWLDMDNFDNVIEQSRFDNNLGANLFLEWTTDRTIVRNNVFTRARYARPSFYGHGVLIHAANDNLVLYNTFMGNEGGGMRIRADSRDMATGNRYYNNLFVANTKIVHGTDRRSSELSFEQHRSLSDARSNKGDGNVFWSRKYANEEYNTFLFRPDNPSSDEVLKSSKLSEWQDIAKTDYSSAVTKLADPHVRDTTDYGNGWRLADNSQYLSRAVPLPGDIPPVLFDFDGERRPEGGGSVGADQFGTSGSGGSGGGGGSGGSDGGGGTDGGNGTGGGNNEPTLTRVQFVALNFTLREDRVEITWEASNEKDLDSYVIERSKDGDAYQRIGSIEKIPDPSSSNRYAFRDQDLPSSGRKLYYRIQNVYNDRSITYSPISEVQLSLPEKISIEPHYPNPAQSFTRISYNLPTPMGVTLKLYDALGREVKTLIDIGKPAGRHTIFVDVSDLPSGTYYYRFDVAGSVQSRSLTVIH